MAKLRFGFVTNSSSSCFIIKSPTEIPYTKDIVRESFIEVFNKYNATNNGGSYKPDIDDVCDIDDSKLHSKYKNYLYDFHDDPMDCPHDFSYRWDYEKESGRELMCDICPDNTGLNGNICPEAGTLLEKALNADVLVVGWENAIPYELLEELEKVFPGTTRYHLG